ncbi:MAG: hypothetical protein JWO78_2345 [Micavibrio sp.]|nr:hypothetical protein [Micavibrio sp.]
MSNYPHPVFNQIDISKFSGTRIHPALIPATDDADDINITVIFNTHSSIVHEDNAQFIDENKNRVTGVHVRHSMHTIHVANCSLNGLVALSKDSRVFSINLAKRSPER